jgi:hypothetical protein
VGVVVAWQEKFSTDGCAWTSRWEGGEDAGRYNEACPRGLLTPKKASPDRGITSWLLSSKQSSAPWTAVQIWACWAFLGRVGERNNCDEIHDPRKSGEQWRVSLTAIGTTRSAFSLDTQLLTWTLGDVTFSLSVCETKGPSLVADVNDCDAAGQRLLMMGKVVVGE